MTAPVSSGAWRRIAAGLRARPGRGQFVAAVLCGVLAFAVVAQAHTTSRGAVTAARSQDLLTILANLQGRADRLHDRLRYKRDDRSASGWALERLSP